MLAVYNSCTPSGIACIVYLLCDLDVYVYTLYTILSSGAYCGGTVGSVMWVAAQNHRDSRVINTGAAYSPQWKPLRKSHLSRVLTRFARVWARSGEWLMRHTKNSHNSALFHTLSHSIIYHTPSSGATMRPTPYHPISISHFSAPTEYSCIV